jgi:hypothetical protein
VTSPIRALAFVAGAGLIFIFAACGNDTKPSAHSTTTTTHRATTTTTTSTTTTSTTKPPPATSTTSTSGATVACSHITASAGQSQGAAGTITGVITVTNAGPSTCTVNGYPTIALYSGSGAPITVTMVNGLTVSVSAPANAPPSTVSVAPSSTAQFAYQYSDVPVGNETSCPASESASVTLPGTSAGSGSFALAIAPCNNGTIHVSPVYASS